MNIKKIALGVCLSAVAAGVYQANYRYPSMTQAGNACWEWKEKGGTYDYIHQTESYVPVGEPVYMLGSWIHQEWETKVTREETKSAYYRSCTKEDTTNQYLGYQNKGEGTDTKIVKHFRF